MTCSWHIRNGRQLDPATGADKVADLFICDGIIVDDLPAAATQPVIVDATGLTVAPGLIDLHVHFREPGNEDAETILSGSRAALCGGFTRVVTMPNTRPPVDTPERVAGQLALAHSAGPLRIMPAGCLTADRGGSTVADLGGMLQAGAVAFTDDGSTVPDDTVMEAAMRRAGELGRPVLDHAIDPSLAGEGVVRAGPAADRLGVPGMPAEAEVRAVQRDIALSERTGCAVHIQHLSTRGAVALLRDAHKRGLPVSAEATPHHIALSEADITHDDAALKMNPPLGTAQDQQALLDAVADGCIEVLATDHAPHTAELKARGFARAPFGIIGLESAVGVSYTTLVAAGRMPAMEWLRRWTTGPARVLGLTPPSLAPGAPGDIVLLDLETEWVLRKEHLQSKSQNCPFIGQTLRGRALLTLVQGQLAWQCPEADARVGGRA